MAGEVIRRHTYGQSGVGGPAVIGIAALNPVAAEPRRPDHIRVIRGNVPPKENVRGYAGLLTDLTLAELSLAANGLIECPGIFGAAHIDFIHDGDVLKLEFQTGYARSLYRVHSDYNVIFATDRCN